MRRPSERIAASSSIPFSTSDLEILPGSNASRVELRAQACAPRRLMLLTSNLGMGHLRATQAIVAAMQTRSPQSRVRTLDFWELMHSGIARVVHDIYLQLVQRYPALYDGIHGLDEHTWRQILQTNEPPSPAVLSALQMICAMCPSGLANIPQRQERYAADRVIYPILRAALPGTSGGSLPGGVLRLGVVRWVWRTLARRLAQLVQEFAPDIIISTQMLPAALLSSIKYRRAWHIPSIGVLTDYGIHDFWVQRHTDHYCVAHGEIANVAESGLRSSVVSDTGVPLMPGFAAPPTQIDARRALGYDPVRPLVLVLGGGLGLGIETLTGQLLALPEQVRLVVMIGRNSKAEGLLRRMSAQYPQRLEVLGWADRVEYLMRAADIVVGKPGGLTVAEVLACGRPLFATRSLGGQEGFNLRFLQQHGVGKLVTDDTLVPLIDGLLKAPEQLSRLQNRAWQLGRRHGAERVISIAQQLALTRASLAKRGS